MLRSKLASMLLVVALQVTCLAHQKQYVNVTTTSSLYTTCYGIGTVAGSVTRRVNGRDVPVPNVTVQIRVGGTVLGQAKTQASGAYSARIELGEKLVGDNLYDFNASVVTTNVVGSATGRLRVNKATSGFGYILLGRPIAGQQVGVELRYYTVTGAPRGGHWINTNIGSGRTDANGYLYLRMTPRKGSNPFKVDFNGTPYLKSFKGTYYIVGQ